MINFGAGNNNPFEAMNLGATGGAGFNQNSQMNMMMQMMQMMMQLLSTFMNSSGSGIIPGGGFGGMAGRGNGLTSFLGAAPGGGYGGGYGGGGGGYGGGGSYGGGNTGSLVSNTGGGGGLPMISGPVDAPKSGIEGITPQQFDQPFSDRGSMCGIVAATGMARALGKDVAVGDVRQIALNNNYYDGNNGMHGPANEVNLLNKLGIPAHQETNIDWNKVAKTVQSGRPVIIDSEGHYWVVEGYDPKTGKFNFGNSAKAMKASGGNVWYSPQELGQKFGAKYAPRSAIFSDVPLPQQQGAGQQGSSQQGVGPQGAVQQPSKPSPQSAAPRRQAVA